MPTIPSAMRTQVRLQDRNRCAYCHTPEELTVTPFEVDHIVPVSVGGQAILENLCLACPACNRFKGNLESGKDPLTGEDVLLFNPRRQFWSEHFRWGDDRLEIQGITAQGRVTVIALRMNRPQLVNLRRLWLKMGYLLVEE